MWQRTTLDIVPARYYSVTVSSQYVVQFVFVECRLNINDWTTERFCWLLKYVVRGQLGSAEIDRLLLQYEKKDVHLCDVSHHHSFINNSIHRQCHTWNPCLLIHLYIALNLCYNLQAAICICFVWWQICTKIRSKGANTFYSPVCVTGHLSDESCNILNIINAKITKIKAALLFIYALGLALCIQCWNVLHLLLLRK